MSRAPRPPRKRRPAAPEAPPPEPRGEDGQSRLTFTPDPGARRGAFSPARKAAALAAIILGSSLAFIDGSIVGVALPAIQGDLAAGAGQIQWVVNGYLLAVGALVLIGGAVGDRYGRKRVFLIGTVLFTLASLLCGAVWTAENLIAGRVLQGLGAAMLIPTSLALIPVCFGEHERGRALGLWAGASALAAAAAPLLGGWLTEMVSWRAVFFINGPVALAAIVLALIAIPESRDREAHAPDWLGAALGAVALGLFGWGLSAAVDWGLASLRLWGVLAGSVAAGAAFFWVERRVKHPMLPLEMFRFRAFAGVNVLTFALYFALSGVLFLVPFEWMRVDGRTAAQVGAGLLPFAAVMGIGSPLVGRAADRLGPRLFLILGPAIAGMGFLLMAWPEPGADYFTRWLPAVVTLAVGMTLTVAPLTTALFASVDADRAGVASGVNNAAARVAGMAAVAIMTLVVALVFAQSVDAPGDGGSDAVTRRLAALMGGGGTEGAVTEAERAAFRLGFQVCVVIGAVCAFAAAAVAAATVPKGRVED